MNKHTPGPWEVFPKNRKPTEVKALFGSARYDESQLTPVVRLGIGQNQEANARLIAAAPDLLEALEYLMEIVDLQAFYDFSGELVEFPDRVQAKINTARAAIAKAKGEE